jgi:hypothetical protein
MNYNPTSTEWQIIKILHKGPFSSTEIVTQIEKKLMVSKQAIYKELRKLERREIIIKTKKLIILNGLWVQEMKIFFEEAHLIYTTTNNDGYMRLLDGDSIVYRFKNFNTTDIFWGTAFYSLSHQIKQGDYIFMYNPHQWFLLARPNSERKILKQIHNEGKKLVSYIAGNTKIDHYLRRYFISKTQQYYPSGKYLFKKENYYINIFNDYIIEVWLDPVISKKINIFFQTHTTITDHALDEINDIILQEGKNKLKISRNKAKADMLKRKLMKFFI